MNYYNFCLLNISSPKWLRLASCYLSQSNDENLTLIATHRPPLIRGPQSVLIIASWKI